MTESNKAMTEAEIKRSRNAPVIRRPDDYTPEKGRFQNMTQMVFHPTEAAPTEPNAGVITYLPGASFPLHKHDFAQVWYIIEGECRFGDETLKAGDMVYMADPHFEHEMQTEGGCKILFVQYPGPNTGARPIYQGRFNQKETPVLAEQDLEH